MGKLNKQGFALPLLIILSSLAGPTVMAASSCHFVEEATLPANFKDSEVLVDVAINGVPAKFQIGTSSAFTQISRSMAQRLHLPIRDGVFKIPTPRGTRYIAGAGVSPIKIGERVGSTNTLQIMDEGGDGTTDDFAGVIGRDYLSNFDVELDPMLKRVNLFAPIACPSDAAYWANEHFELPVGTDRKHRPRVRVTLDGKELYAFLDTALAHSSIDAAVAEYQLNTTGATQSAMKAAGAQAPNPTFAFKELVFGPITIRHPQLELQSYRGLDIPQGSSISASASDDAPIIIGMDILGKFHSMISVQNGMLYFTLPNERLSAAGVTSKP